MLLILHLVAVLLAALALWLMRHEVNETAAHLIDWLLGPILATAAGVIMLVVSPGKRWEFWLIAIGAGLVLGVGAGLLLKPEKDFAHNLVRIPRALDGMTAAAILLILTLTRVVTTDLLGRTSSGFGILGAGSVFLGLYLLGRVLSLQLMAQYRGHYVGMERGQKRPPV